MDRKEEEKEDIEIMKLVSFLLQLVNHSRNELAQKLFNMAPEAI